VGDTVTSILIHQDHYADDIVAVVCITMSAYRLISWSPMRYHSADRLRTESTGIRHFHAVSN